MHAASKEAIDLLTRILRLMCRRRDCLSVELKRETASTALLKINCHVDDRASIIGRGGARFRALRFIVERVGERQKRIVSLDHIPELPGKPAEFGEFRFNKDWPEREILALVKDIARYLSDKPESVAVELTNGTRRNATINVRTGITVEHQIKGAEQCLQFLLSAIGSNNGCHLTVGAT